MAEQYDCQQVLELLFDDGFELFDSSDSEEEDAGESSYLGTIVHGSVDELTTRRTSTASASTSPDYCEWDCVS